MRFIPTIMGLFYSTSVFAQQTTEPVVGSHVSSMNALSMIVALLIVLAVIVIVALILKRFNLVQTNQGQLKIITSLMVGNKEKIVVVQVGEKQLLLGVTAQQISILDVLDKPILPTQVSNQQKASAQTSILSLLKKNIHANNTK